MPAWMDARFYQSYEPLGNTQNFDLETTPKNWYIGPDWLKVKAVKPKFWSF
jgi:hypothetical protein